MHVRKIERKKKTLPLLSSASHCVCVINKPTNANFPFLSFKDSFSFKNKKENSIFFLKARRLTLSLSVNGSSTQERGRFEFQISSVFFRLRSSVPLNSQPCVLSVCVYRLRISSTLYAMQWNKYLIKSPWTVKRMTAYSLTAPL